jgi:hypothetical protein
MLVEWFTHRRDPLRAEEAPALTVVIGELERLLS